MCGMKGLNAIIDVSGCILCDVRGVDILADTKELISTVSWKS